VTLSRAQLIAVVAGELDDVLTLAKLTAVDDAPNLKGPIDRTFRAIGVAEAGLAAATVADGGEQQAIAYATYFVLQRATWALTDRMDVSGARGGAKLRQRFENVRDRLDEALSIAQHYGLAIPGNGAITRHPLIYAGGVSSGDYDAVASDGDRMKPLFTVR
jgi:hypothetical protein